MSSDLRSADEIRELMATNVDKAFALLSCTITQGRAGVEDLQLMNACGDILAAKYGATEPSRAIMAYDRVIYMESGKGFNLDIRVDTIGLCSRALSALRCPRNPSQDPIIITVAQLVQWTDRTLRRRYRGMGRASVNDIKERLKANGLSLGMFPGCPKLNRNEEFAPAIQYAQDAKLRVIENFQIINLAKGLGVERDTEKLSTIIKLLRSIANPEAKEVKAM